MKIIKSSDVEETTKNKQKKTLSPNDVILGKEESESKKNSIDQKKVEELREKFDLINKQITGKEYSILLSVPQTKFLFETIYENIQWKGYESYAISETYDALKKAVNKKGELNGKVKVEIIEAIFHFLKNFVFEGVENARIFRQVCDQFALPMTEINQDRQNLRDASLELVSAEQGIPIEDFVANLKKQQSQQQFQG